jgi:Acetoacetate decarboxylase (ADC)
MRSLIVKGAVFGLDATRWVLDEVARTIDPEREANSGGAGTAAEGTRATGSRAPGTSHAAGPQYVDYGALMTPPAPFESLNTSLWGFWAQADSERMAQLCDKVFAQPTSGAVRCRPLSHHLMITWGSIAKVVSATPPFDQRGGVAEPQVAIWIPVVLRDPVSHHERFAMFIPYLWLSNPMSLATGRELFGYPKSGGTPEFPARGAGPQTWKLSVFGLDYSADSIAGWDHPLLEVVQANGSLEDDQDELGSLHDVARDAARRLFDDPNVIGGFEIAESLLVDLVADRLPNVFLKQFRSVQDGLLAAFQQVTEADYEITKLSAWPVLREHHLTVQRLDSHPVIDELGLESQRLGPAYRVQMNFNVGGGRVLWDGASR